MSEGLLSRVSRLVSGHVSDVVDALENGAPETVMSAAIMEIEDAVSDVRSELGRAIADRHHANKRLMDTASKHDELSQKVQLAVDEGRDDLAEAAIARQLDYEAQIPVLETALKNMGEQQTELEGFVSALLARKREMEADLDAYREAQRARTGALGDATGAAGNSAGGIACKKLQAEDAADRATSAFDRVLKNASGIATSANGDSATAARLAELDQIAHAHRVSERLAAVKAMKEQS